MADHFEALVMIEESISAHASWHTVSTLMLPFGVWSVAATFMYCGQDGVELALIRDGESLAERCSDGVLDSWQYGSIECVINVEDKRVPLQVLAEDVWEEERELAKAPKVGVQFSLRSPGSKAAWVRELKIVTRPVGL